MKSNFSETNQTSSTDMNTSGEDVGIICNNTDKAATKYKAQNLLSPQDVEVNIRCSIGNVNISINELLNLKLGDVIEFCRWPATVKLSVNNRYFAEGILVEIEGLLGVKLTKKLLNIN